MTYEIGPQPPDDDPDMDLCAWCLTRADHVAAGELCYERNSERNRTEASDRPAPLVTPGQTPRSTR